MDFEELLNEVEGAIQDPIRTKSYPTTNKIDGNTVTSYSQGKQSTCRSPTSGKSDIDDLLDIIGDTSNEREKASAKTGVKSAAASGSFHSTRPKEEKVGVTPEAKGGASRKCTSVFISGAKEKRGLYSAVTSACVCNNLRCTACDFTVVQFIGRQWDDSADYMFFRENMPNERKLSNKLTPSADAVAYACQCYWLSVSKKARLDSSSEMKWSCGGHNSSQ